MTPKKTTLMAAMAVSRDPVYVVHAGGAVGDMDSVSGFRLGNHGELTPLVGSSRLLSGMRTGPVKEA